MKNKRGFTLVELLAVIAILSIIMIMTVPRVINQINNKKDTLLEANKGLIIAAARNYVLDYAVENPVSIPLSDLCDFHYIDCPIEDPVSKTNMNGYVNIDENKIYTYSNEELYNSRPVIVLNLDGGTSTQTLAAYYNQGDSITLVTPTKTGYNFIGWSATCTACLVNNVYTVGTDNDTINAIWESILPVYAYTGSSTLVDDGSGNWRIKFLSSGTFTYNGSGYITIDVFVVGGGGKGTVTWGDVASGFGGGGGCTTTQKSIVIKKGVAYNITVGTGSTSSTSRGGATSAFGIVAVGGTNGAYASSGDGGSGGSDRGSAGGVDGANGTTAGYDLGYGQLTTTKEFGESTGYVYSNGGSGNAYSGAANPPRANSGDGSNGVNGTPYDGAAGIAVIRNHYPNGSDDASSIPSNLYTYSGNSILINYGSGNWRIKFLSSGTFVYNNSDILTIDVFGVGGGGRGTGVWSDVASGFGGGGGYTTTQSSVVIRKNVSYNIIIGTGATSSAGSGTTSAFGIYALGGGNGGYADAGDGGSGGSDRGSAGGTNGGNGATAGYTLGYGQGSTTKEFGESAGYIYSNGGSGNGYQGGTLIPRANSGDGSSGTAGTICDGADGVAIIKKHYESGTDDATNLLNFTYTYTGNNLLLNDGSGNWRIKFLTSGTFVYTGTAALSIDAFVVGGGGKGTVTWGDVASGFGGGGGLTTTQLSIAITKDATYPIVVGAGATATGASTRGGTSSAFGISAIGGQGGDYANAGDGGSGGSDRGSAGGTNGSNGGTAGYTLGYGQGTTTKEFGESTGYMYSNGGSGNSYSGWASMPRNNSGDGSNGTTTSQYNGAAGIAVIRNHR